MKLILVPMAPLLWFSCCEYTSFNLFLCLFTFILWNPIPIWWKQQPSIYHWLRTTTPHFVWGVGDDEFDIASIHVILWEILSIEYLHFKSLITSGWNICSDEFFGWSCWFILFACIWRPNWLSVSSMKWVMYITPYMVVAKALNEPEIDYGLGCTKW